MPEAPSDLHGNVPDTCSTALLLIDVINDMEFEGGDDLFRYALPAAHRIATLKKQARSLRIPVIYANDNFGRWRSDFREVIDHCVQDDVRGQPVARLLLPHEDDYFVLKPKHSAFFSTSLQMLLEHLKAERLILTGFSGDICVLFTAGDAYMRDFEIHVPSDCIASRSDEENRQALAYMQRALGVDTAPSTELDLAAMVGKSE